MAELKLRIYQHRWGGMMGWMKCNIRLNSVSKDMVRGMGLAELGNKAELDQLGLWLNWSLEDIPGWWGGGGEKLGIKLKLSFS